MKKILLTMMLLFPAITQANTTDPFYDNTWYIDQHEFTAKYHTPLPIPGHYDHSIAYTLPDGMYVATDQCYLTSATTLNCTTGDNASYDAAAHSVTLTTGYNTYMYYEKGYQPQGSPMSGKWDAVNPIRCEYASLIIPYTNTDATTFNNVDGYFSGGGVTRGMTFYLGKDKRSGSFFFGAKPNQDIFSYHLYDAKNQRITDMNELGNIVKMQDWLDDACVYIKA